MSLMLCSGFLLSLKCGVDDSSLFLLYGIKFSCALM